MKNKNAVNQKNKKKKTNSRGENASKAAAAKRMYKRENSPGQNGEDF